MNVGHNINLNQHSTKKMERLLFFFNVALKFNKAGCDWIWRDVAKFGAKTGVVPVSNRLWIKPFWEGETKHALIPE